MKRFIYEIITFFISLLILSSIKNVNAFEFVKSTENPLKVNYINGYTYQLQHHIFKEGDIYKGIFVINRSPEAYYSLGYFESPNGNDWQMKKEVLNIGSDLSNPSIIKTVNGYLLFVTRYDNNLIYRIYSSNCDNDFNCSSSLQPVITPNTSNISESNGVFAGHPFQQNGRTYLFFGAWGGDGFKLKLAYSDDLINWQRCTNSFLYGGDGPFPFQEDNNLFIFFHRSDSSGIKVAKTTLPLSCTSTFADQGYVVTKNMPYDQNHIIFPSLINENNKLKLYYSGLGNGMWNLNMAISLGSGNPTPTITPTQTPTLTPTPYILRPIILIPGFLASWNKKAIIHNVIQHQTNWKINPMVNDYKAIIQTLKNLGYEENKNLFVFAYDWRKPILSIVDDLKNYIDQLHPTPYSLPPSYSIVGHSLGGLIGRIYDQKYDNSNVEKLITVGSPHYGATQFYKLVEAGELDRSNSFQWLAAKTLVALNKNNIETDKQTINRIFPIMKDLLPVFNFLKKGDNEISSKDMEIKNELLRYYNANWSNNSNESNLISIVGEKGNTLKGYNVVDQNFLDQLLDIYPDGRPISSYYEIGDNIVISASSKFNKSEVLPLDHGELIYKKQAIKKILELLNISYNDSQIIEGNGTNIDSSLIFLIKSPATMEVNFDNHVYNEQDGLIFIENAQSGDYQLKVTGTDQGNYQLIIGQISKNNDKWDNIYSDTTSGKIDNYLVSYDQNNPKNYFETIDSPLEMFDELLNYLKINPLNWHISKKVEEAFEIYKLKNSSENYGILNSIKIEIIKSKDFIALNKLENIEKKIFIKKRSCTLNQEINKIEDDINSLKQPVDQMVLTEIINRLVIIKNADCEFKEILLDSIKELLKVVQK